MKFLLSVVLFFFIQNTFAQNGPVCDQSKTLDRVFGSLNQFLCLSAFHDPSKEAQETAQRLDCAKTFLLSGAAVAGASASFAAASAAKTRLIDSKKISETSRALSQTTKQIQKASNYPNYNTGSSFKEFGRYVKEGFLPQKIQDQSQLSEQLNRLRGNVEAHRRLSKNILKAGAAFGATLATLGIVVGTADALLSAKPTGCAEFIDAYRDTDASCRTKTEVGPNTARFLSLPRAEQEKIMTADPRLCSDYENLATKLEKNLDQMFPWPDFKVTACNTKGEVEGLQLAYPQKRWTIVGDGSQNLKLASETSRVNYEIVLKDKGYGAGSVSVIRAAMKTSRVTRAHVPEQVVNSEDKLARRETNDSLQAYHGYLAVKNFVGKNCSLFVENQSQELDATTPTRQ